MRRIAKFSIVISTLSLCALPLAAQNHAFHAAGTAPMHVAGAAPLHAAGTFAPGRHFRGGPGVPVARHHRRSAFPRYGYGYGYIYGAPYLLPYDNGYEQPDDAEGYEQSEAPEAQESRSGPTIFEHNGYPSAARTREVEREEPAPTETSSQSASLPPTILVFRDGHQQEIESYAIAGAKLIVLGERPQKIQLSDLDIDATAKVNDDRGVDFKLPNQS
jgi:hypothetical protein